MSEMSAEATEIAMQARKARWEETSAPLPESEVNRLLTQLHAAGIPARHEVRSRDLHDWDGSVCHAETYSVFVVPTALAQRAAEVLNAPPDPSWVSDGSSTGQPGCPVCGGTGRKTRPGVGYGELCPLCARAE
jgi:hypothetical protein